jgi:hypothetical protein
MMAYEVAKFKRREVRVLGYDFLNLSLPNSARRNMMTAAAWNWWKWFRVGRQTTRLVESGYLFNPPSGGASVSMGQQG